MVKRATRQDVAQAAGVSGATVSRVYNHPDLVDTATKERVRQAAASLGFVPDKNAAALRRRSGGTLLFVEIEAGEYQWPAQRAYQSLYGEIVRAVLHAVQKSPLTLQLVTLASVADIPSLERFGDVAGILGFDVTDQAAATALAALGPPVVCAHHGDHLQGVGTVTTDNRVGGRLQADFLSAAGHTRVAYVTGRTEVRSHNQRRLGFTEGLAPVVEIDAVGYQEGTAAGVALAPGFRSGEITAVACVNDLTALGVRQGLAAGLSLPPDVVVGYDNLVMTGLLAPGLPTIEARLPEVYTRALEWLVRPGEAEFHQTIVPKLVRAN